MNKLGKIMIFGAGMLQISLIKTARKLGYYTIVLDPDSTAIGKSVADEFIVLSGSDFEKTYEIANKNKVKGIVTAATDKPILMMCRIAEEIGLPFPSYESCETVLDKAKFKQFLNKNDFPHARGFECKGCTIGSSLLNITFPVIIKPVINSGSRGVIKCDNTKVLKEAINETLLHCNDERYLVEEYIEGDEISVEALAQNHIVHLLQVTDKIVTPPPYNVELGHVQPSKYEYLKPSIEKLLQSIVEKSGLNDCALHFELKVSEDKMTTIEIGPRLGGDFITSHLVLLSTGVNMEEQLINIAVGKIINYKLETKASMVTYLNFPIDRKITRTITEDEMKERFPDIEQFCFDLKVGDETTQITNSLNRYGQFVLAGENLQSLYLYKEEIKRFLENYIINHER